MDGDKSQDPSKRLLDHFRALAVNDQDTDEVRPKSPVESSYFYRNVCVYEYCVLYMYCSSCFVIAPKATGMYNVPGRNQDQHDSYLWLCPCVFVFLGRPSVSGQCDL